MGRNSAAAKVEKRRHMIHAALGMGVMGLLFSASRAFFMVLREEAGLLLALAYVAGWTGLTAFVGALLARLHKLWPMTTRLPWALGSCCCLVVGSTIFAELGTLAGTPWSNALAQPIGFLLGAILIYVVYRVVKSRGGRRRRPAKPRNAVAQPAESERPSTANPL